MSLYSNYECDNAPKAVANCLVSSCRKTLQSFPLGGVDYESFDGTIVFDGGSVSGEVRCISIEILDDRIIERTEDFTAHLEVELGADNVVVHIPYVIIYIDDNDGMSLVEPLV